MTQRIPAVSQTQGNVKDIFDNVQKKIGMVPNLFRVIGNSEAVLKAYLDFNGTISSHVKLPAAFREQIAVAVAGQNQCDYCASAHTAGGKAHKVSEDELKKNLSCDSNDPKTKAALSFIKIVVQKRGQIEDMDLEDVREAGYSNEEIVEMVAHIALNTFTNYMNNICRTEIDFPLVKTH